MSDINDEVIKRLDRQDTAMQRQNEAFMQLTGSINELSQVLARKEVSDHHVEQQLTDHGRRLNDCSERVRALEKIEAGNEARLEIQRWVWRSVIGLAVTAVGGSIIWVIAQSGGVEVL